MDINSKKLCMTCKTPKLIEVEISNDFYKDYLSQLGHLEVNNTSITELCLNCGQIQGLFPLTSINQKK